MPPEKKTDAAKAAEMAAKKAVSEVLEEALAQRSKFHLSFDPKVSSLKDIAGALYSHDDFNVVIELTGVAGVSRTWAGEVVTAYFEIMDRSTKAGLFYSFAARVEELTEKSGGRHFLHLVFPAGLSRSQRRKSLRVHPDIVHFADLKVWIYDAEGKFDLDKPFVVLDDCESGRAKVENMSAGGMGLVFDPVFLDDAGVSVAKGLRMIIAVAVCQTAAPGDKSSWLIARVVHTYTNPITHAVTAGIEFIAEGRLGPNNKVSWKKVEGNIVENVGAWTYAWYLQQIR